MMYTEDGVDLTPGPEHQFHQETLICDTSEPECTLDLVFSKMLEAPAWGDAVPEPGQPNPCGDLHRGKCTVPVQDGDKTMVEIAERPNADDDVGLVSHTVIPSQHVLVNTTEPGYIFHPGNVTRRAVIDGNGFVKIVTDGAGTGPYKELNEVFGPSVFSGVDENVKARVEAVIP